MFGQLWIDEPALVEDRLEKTPRNIRPFLSEFIDKGYTIFPKAAPDGVVDQILQGKEAIYSEQANFVMKSEDGVRNTRSDRGKLKKLDKTNRILDLHAV